jgi:hypothetical protein
MKFKRYTHAASAFAADPGIILRTMSCQIQTMTTISKEYIRAMHTQGHLLSTQLAFGSYLQLLETLFNRGEAVQNFNALCNCRIFHQLLPQALQSLLENTWSFYLSNLTGLDALPIVERKKLTPYHILALLLQPCVYNHDNFYYQPWEKTLDEVITLFCEHFTNKDTDENRIDVVALRLILTSYIKKDLKAILAVPNTYHPHFSGQLAAPTSPAADGKPPAAQHKRRAQGPHN